MKEIYGKKITARFIGGFLWNPPMCASVRHCWLVSLFMVPDDPARNHRRVLSSTVDKGIAPLPGSWKRAQGLSFRWRTDTGLCHKWSNTITARQAGTHQTACVCSIAFIHAKWWWFLWLLHAFTLLRKFNMAPFVIRYMHTEQKKNLA